MFFYEYCEKILKNTQFERKIFANDCFVIRVSYLSSAAVMSYVLLFTVLKRHSICDAIFSLIFFCYIIILLVEGVYIKYVGGEEGEVAGGFTHFSKNIS